MNRNKPIYCFIFLLYGILMCRLIFMPIANLHNHSRRASYTSTKALLNHYYHSFAKIQLVLPTALLVGSKWQMLPDDIGVAWILFIIIWHFKMSNAGAWDHLGIEKKSYITNDWFSLSFLCYLVSHWALSCVAWNFLRHNTKLQTNSLQN